MAVLEDISVLVISFNCWHLLDDCLKSLYAAGDQYREIIVIDNASVDGTPDQLKKHYPGVRLIENNENIGHTRAVNQGCRLVKGELVLLLDADTVIHQNCIRIMALFMKQHPQASMAAPKTYLGDGTLQDSAKNFPSPINGIFGRQSLLTRLFPNNAFSKRYLVLTDRENQKTPFKVEHVSAACMLFRRSLFDIVGEWDEGYRSYWVDADWCKRIQIAGGEIYYLPDATITHYEQNRRSLKKNPERIIQFHTGSFRFYTKYHTRGKEDPRRFMAAALLSAHAMLKLVSNRFKKSPVKRVDPLTMQKR